MISPGAIVRVYRYGDIAWVVERQQPDGDGACAPRHRPKGRAMFSGRTASENDLVLVRPRRVISQVRRSTQTA